MQIRHVACDAAYTTNGIVFIANKIVYTDIAPDTASVHCKWHLTSLTATIIGDKMRINLRWTHFVHEKQRK